MNGPTVVLLIVAALWPIWAMFHQTAGDRFHRGTFTYQVTDDDGNVLEEGTADLKRIAIERGEAAAERWRMEI